MTGMTWDEVEDTMTMPRLNALREQWKSLPPIAASTSWLAQYHGLKVEKPKQQKKDNKGAATELAQALGGL